MTMTRLQATAMPAALSRAYGGLDAIDSSYGTIGSIPWLGSGGGDKEGSQNMGGAEAIWGGKKSR